MASEVYIDGMLRERMNDETRMYTVWDSEGIPIESRPYTDEENAAADDGGTSTPEDENRALLYQQAMAAYQNNNAFLALASPTNAQTLAQVKALTRQINGAFRLLRNDYSGTD